MKFEESNIEKKKYELTKIILGKYSSGKSKALMLLALIDEEVPEELAKKILNIARDLLKHD